MQVKQQRARATECLETLQKGCKKQRLGLGCGSLLQHILEYKSRLLQMQAITSIAVDIYVFTVLTDPTPHSRFLSWASYGCIEGPKFFFSFYAFCFFQPPFALFSGCKNDFLCLLSSLETEHWYFVAVRGMKCFPAIHFLPPLAFFRQRLCGTAPCFWFTPISLTHSLAPL